MWWRWPTGEVTQGGGGREARLRTDVLRAGGEAALGFVGSTFTPPEAVPKVADTDV